MPVGEAHAIGALGLQAVLGGSKASFFAKLTVWKCGPLHVMRIDYE
jgi:hypothetical protein